MRRARGKADLSFLDAVNLDAVVLEQIFLGEGMPAGDVAERLRRRRLLRRLLRRPAARIASRQIRRKRLLDRLDQLVLGPGLRSLHQQRRGEMRAVLSGVRPARARVAPPPARPARASRWASAGRNGRARRG